MQYLSPFVGAAIPAAEITSADNATDRTPTDTEASLSRSEAYFRRGSPIQRCST